jgi:hypothetical protein
MGFIAGGKVPNSKNANLGVPFLENGEKCRMDGKCEGMNVA